VGRAHGSLPNHTLVVFAVAHKDEHPPVRLVKARRKRHPDANRKPVAERAGRHLYAGYIVHVRVHAERALEAVIVVGELLVVEAGVQKHGGKPKERVALAEHEPVTVRQRRVLCVILHRMEIKGGQDVYRGKGTAKVAAPRTE
jgi:hypothetical protein